MLLHGLLTLAKPKDQTLAIELSVNGTQLTMELNAGAVVYLISEQMLKTTGPNATLQLLITNTLQRRIAQQYCLSV